jgi:acyl-CoA synthetase (NDP forming)
MVTEVLRSPSRPTVHLVNPRYGSIEGLPSLPSLDDVQVGVDLVMMGVRDSALAGEFERAAARGDRSAVIFGAAHDPVPGVRLRERIASVAASAGMAVCGGGCMGFVNCARGLRAIGYLEPFPMPTGQVALVTHSGSAFSTLLRMQRRIGWSVAISSGQELVTTTGEFLDYALNLPETEVVALLLEAMRDPGSLRAALDRAARQNIPVVALTVGTSPKGRSMVAAHSGALAGSDGAWEAVFDAHGVLRVSDLAEMADTLELLCAGRRTTTHRRPGSGVATVHDSGAERVLAADMAEGMGVPFASLSAPTRERLASLLDPGLRPDNPLDVWGTGAATRNLFAACLEAMASDDNVEAVALAVDLVPEFDEDDSYPLALLQAKEVTEKPLALLASVSSAIDTVAAARLREAGIPVLEGTRSGLRAIAALLELRDFRERAPVVAHAVDEVRRSRWLQRLDAAPLRACESMSLLSDYGIRVPRAIEVSDRESAVSAAGQIRFPVVLKTDEPSILHRSDVGGVALGLRDSSDVTQAYDAMRARLGPRAVIAEMAAPGVELSVGITRDPDVGLLLVLGAGGTLVEFIADRAVALPPVDAPSARRLLGRLRARHLLDGVRGQPGADLDSVAAAVAAVSDIAVELGPVIEALDINPLRATATGAVALDALVISCSGDRS